MGRPSAMRVATNPAMVAPLPAETWSLTLLSKISGSISRTIHKLDQSTLLYSHPSFVIRFLIASRFKFDVVLAAFSPNRFPRIHAFLATHLGILIGILGLMQLFTPH